MEDNWPGESETCPDSGQVTVKDFLLVAYDLLKVINNGDGEVIITEDQPEENTDSMPADQKVSYFH